MNVGKFRHKGLRSLFERNDPRGVPPENARKIANILTALESAADLSQVATMPGWKLHPLKGDRDGEFAISVTRNWRMTFRCSDGNVTDVDLEDYH